MTGIPFLINVQDSLPEFTKWKRDTEVAIEQIFGKEGRHLKDFGGVSYLGVIQFDDYGDRITTDEEILGQYQRGLMRAKTVLESMIEEIQTYWSDEELRPPEVSEASEGPKRYTDRQNRWTEAIELARKCVSEPGKISPKVGAIVARDGVILGEHIVENLSQATMLSLHFWKAS